MSWQLRALDPRGRFQRHGLPSCIIAAMAEVAALVCTACGAPLGAVTSLPAVVECGFCGAAMAIAHDTQTITRPATTSDEIELRAAKRQVACGAR